MGSITFPSLPGAVSPVSRAPHILPARESPTWDANHHFLAECGGLQGQWGWDVSRPLGAHRCPRTPLSPVYARRLDIFAHNLARAQQLQEETLGTAEFGVTPFSDLTGDGTTPGPSEGWQSGAFLGTGWAALRTRGSPKP